MPRDFQNTLVESLTYFRPIYILGENKSFGSTIGLVSSTSGNPTSPSNTLQDARQSDIVLSTSLSGLTSRVTGTGPDPNDDKEGRI